MNINRQTQKLKKQALTSYNKLPDYLKKKTFLALRRLIPLYEMEETRDKNFMELTNNSRTFYVSITELVEKGVLGPKVHGKLEDIFRLL